TSIAANAAYLEIAIITLVANARYLLMSFAMSQRLAPNLPLHHRLLLGHYLTDELFGIAIARPGYLNPYYTYGAVLLAGPCWGFGTALGNIAGNLLPLRLVSAFSVALYGMFLAIFIPPARKNKVIAGIIVCCFVLSYLASVLPPFSTLSEGTRTILLTVIIAGIAAALFPVPVEKEDS
ncbi:MAG: AzlC family ABC transporter permease, partial [Lachnospiraceae bacterium]|nr:AzlC family ABC transporter permease [Lachnospiraceae bacterium]